MIKRIFDLFVSIIALLLLSPVLLLVTLLIYFNMGKPIIFSQNRPGLNGKIFKMYKFRTMKTSHRSGDLDNVYSDSTRITPLGHFLRATSLDELPELWNVLKGDMSIVGPRPLLVEYLDLYTSHQKRRHEVRPGITGWAQVNGRNSISWDKKFELDIWYVDNWSILLDIRIIYKTAISVVLREGISHSGEVTTTPFKGKKND